MAKNSPPISMFADDIAGISGEFEQSLLNAYSKEKNKLTDDFFGRERAILEGKIERSNANKDYVNLDYKPEDYNRFAFSKKDEFNSFVSEMQYNQVSYTASPVKINGEYLVEVPKTEAVQKVINEFQSYTNIEIEKPKQDDYTARVRNYETMKSLDDYLLWDNMDEAGAIVKKAKHITHMIETYSGTSIGFNDVLKSTLTGSGNANPVLETGRAKKATVLYGGEAVILNGKLVPSNKDVETITAQYNSAVKKVEDLKEIQPAKDNRNNYNPEYKREYKEWKQEYAKAVTERNALKAQMIGQVVQNDIALSTIEKHEKMVAKTDYILNGDDKGLYSTMNLTERIKTKADFGSTSSDVIIAKKQEQSIQYKKYQHEADIINKAIQDIKVYKSKIEDGYSPNYIEQEKMKANERIVHNFENDFLNGKTINTEPNIWVDEKPDEKIVKGGADNKVAHTVANTAIAPTISVAKAGIIGATMVTATIATGGTIAPLLVGTATSTAVGVGLNVAHNQLEKNLGKLKKYEAPSVSGENIVQFITPEMIKEANETVLARAKEKGYQLFDERGRFDETAFKNVNLADKDKYDRNNGFRNLGLSDNSAQMIFRANSQVRQIPVFEQNAEVIKNHIYRQEYAVQGSRVKGFTGKIGYEKFQSYIDTVQLHHTRANGTVETNNIAIIVSEGVLKDIAEEINTERLVVETAVNHKVRDMDAYGDNFKSLAKEYGISDVSELFLDKDEITGEYQNEKFDELCKYATEKNDSKIHLIENRIETINRKLEITALGNILSENGLSKEEIKEKLNIKGNVTDEEIIVKLRTISSNSEKAISALKDRLSYVEKRIDALNSITNFTILETVEIASLRKEKESLQKQIKEKTLVKNKLGELNSFTKTLVLKYENEIKLLKSTNQELENLQLQKEELQKQKEENQKTVEIAKSVFVLSSEEKLMLENTKYLKEIEKSFGIKINGEIKTTDVLKMNHIFLERANELGIDLFEFGFGTVNISMDKLRNLTPEQLKALRLSPELLSIIQRINAHGNFGQVAFGRVAGLTTITGFVGNKFINLLAKEDGGEFIQAVGNVVKGSKYAVKTVEAVHKLGNIRLSDLKNLRKTGIKGLKEAYNRKPVPRKRKNKSTKPLSVKQKKNLEKKTQKIIKKQKKQLELAKKYEKSFVNKLGKKIEGAKKLLENNVFAKALATIKAMVFKLLLYAVGIMIILGAFLTIVVIILMVISSFMNAINPLNIINNLLAPKTYEDTIAWQLYESLEKREDKWINEELKNFDKLFKKRHDANYGNAYKSWNEYITDFPAFVEKGSGIFTELYVNPFYKANVDTYLVKQNKFTGLLSTDLTANSNVYSQKRVVQSGAKYYSVENGHTCNIKDILSMVDVMYSSDIDGNDDTSLESIMGMSPNGLNWEAFKTKVSNGFKWIKLFFDIIGNKEEYTIDVKNKPSITYDTVLNYALSLWELSHQNTVAWSLDFYSTNNPYYYSDGTTQVTFPSQEVASRYGVCITPEKTKFVVGLNMFGTNVVPYGKRSDGSLTSLDNENMSVHLNNSNLDTGEELCINNEMKSDKDNNNRSDEQTYNFIKDYINNHSGLFDTKCWKEVERSDSIYKEFSAKSDPKPSEEEAKQDAYNKVKNQKNNYANGIAGVEYYYEPDPYDVGKGVFKVYTHKEADENVQYFNLQETTITEEKPMYWVAYAKDKNKENKSPDNIEWDWLPEDKINEELCIDKGQLWWHNGHICSQRNDHRDGDTHNGIFIGNDRTKGSCWYYYGCTQQVDGCSAYTKPCEVGKEFTVECKIDYDKQTYIKYERNCEGHTYVYCGGHIGCKSMGVVYSTTNEQLALLGTLEEETVPIAMYYKDAMGNYHDYKLDEHGYDTLRPKYYTDQVNYTSVSTASKSGGCLPPSVDIQGSYSACHGLNLNVSGNTWEKGIEVHGTNAYYYLKDIYDIDCYLDKGEDVFPINTHQQYKGWNEDNMITSILKTTADWKSIYGFDIPLELGEDTLALQDIDLITENIGAINDDRKEAVRTALSWVGRGHYSDEHSDHAFLTSTCQAKPIFVTDSDGVTREVGYDGNCTAGTDKDFLIYYINQIAKIKGFNKLVPNSNIQYQREFDGLGNTGLSPADIIVLNAETGSRERLPVSKADLDIANYEQALAITEHFFNEQYVIYIGKTEEDISLTTGKFIPKNSYITVDLSKYGTFGNIYLHYLTPNDFRDTFAHEYNYWWLYNNNDGSRAKVRSYDFHN